MITVATVVEGDGEIRAVPELIRRLAHQHGVFDVVLPRPFHLPRSKWLTPSEFGRAVELQSRRVEGRGGVVALLDADDDCAVELTKQLVGPSGAPRMRENRECRWFRKFEAELLSILRG